MQEHPKDYYTPPREPVDFQFFPKNEQTSTIQKILEVLLRIEKLLAAKGRTER